MQWLQLQVLQGDWWRVPSSNKIIFGGHGLKRLGTLALSNYWRSSKTENELETTWPPLLFNLFQMPLSLIPFPGCIPGQSKLHLMARNPQ